MSMAPTQTRRPFFRRRKTCPFSGANAQTTPANPAAPAPAAAQAPKPDTGDDEKPAVRETPPDQKAYMEATRITDANKKIEALQNQLNQNTIGKAFDPERQRHRRRAAYEGVGAGGALVTGAAAGHQGIVASGLHRGARAKFELAEKARTESTNKLLQLKQPGSGATKAHWGAATTVAARGVREHNEGVALAREASKFGRRAGLAGAASAGLAAGTYALHRQGKTTGRSYSYR